MDFTFLGEYGVYASAAVSILGSLVAIATVITPLTKTPRDDEALAWFKTNVLHRFSILNPRK